MIHVLVDQEKNGRNVITQIFHKLMFFYILFLPFVTTIFLGAFLLFQVQPIIGKYFLPWFGGSSGVWITSLVFFQLLLFLGYLYAFLLTGLRISVQLVIHALLLILSSFLILILFTKWNSPIMPGAEWKRILNLSPAFQVLVLLSISIGIPYFVLSSTSSLLQRWFNLVWPRRSPYFLYSLSNAGSLLGLIIYPFLIEITLRLKMQGILWSAGYIFYSLLFIFCLYPVPRKMVVKKVSLNLIGKIKSIKILFFAALSSLLLIVATNQITQSLSSAPFFWLIPLTIYLITFILCFSGKKIYKRNTYSYLFLLFSFITIFLQLLSVILPFFIGQFFYTFLLFFGFMIIHSELYYLKPNPSQLNYYYLLIAFGSVLGSFYAGIISPFFIPLFVDFFISMFLIWYLAAKNLIQSENSRLYKLLVPRFFYSKNQVYLIFFATFITLFIVMPVYDDISLGRKTIFSSRNFYGTLKVVKNDSEKGTLLSLINGKISHGGQYENPKLKNKPIYYYSDKSGIGVGILNYPKKNIRIAVIGLGAGVLAAYGQKGDYIRFYEINPQVISVANEYFTYIKDSEATIDVITDDGRLALEKEIDENKTNKYDIIVVDAFSDDAIPVHLVTKEAFEIYLKRLNNSPGMLAMHISNTYIDLIPVIKKQAEYFGLNYIYINNQADDSFSSTSDWMLLTSDKKLFKSKVFANRKSKSESLSGNIKLWTDDFNNLLQIIKFN